MRGSVVLLDCRPFLLLNLHGVALNAGFPLTMENLQKSGGRGLQFSKDGV